MTTPIPMLTVVNLRIIFLVKLLHFQNYFVIFKRG
jgi:hypothetical protein